MDNQRADSPVFGLVHLPHFLENDELQEVATLVALAALGEKIPQASNGESFMV